MSYESDREWHLIQVTSQEEEAWLELMARRDRESDHTPAHGVLGGAAPTDRPAVDSLAAKATDPSGELKDARADVASAAGCSEPRPLSFSPPAIAGSPTAAGLLLLPCPAAVPSSDGKKAA